MNLYYLSNYNICTLSLHHNNVSINLAKRRHHIATTSPPRYHHIGTIRRHYSVTMKTCLHMIKFASDFNIVYTFKFISDSSSIYKKNMTTDIYSIKIQYQVQ